MTDQETREEIQDLVWSMNDRIIIIAILGIFGFMILSFSSMHSETFTQSDVDTINFVFSGVAALLSAYAVLPFFRFGLDHWEESIGKAFALGAPVVVVVAYVV